MDIWDIVAGVAALYGAYKIGQLSVILPIARLVHSEVEAGRLKLDDLDTESDTEVSETLLRFEQHSGVYYAYAEQDGQFLAQGPDFLTVFRSIKERFPGKDFRVNKIQKELSDAEVTAMIRSIFEVFGEKK